MTYTAHWPVRHVQMAHRPEREHFTLSNGTSAPWLHQNLAKKITYLLLKKIRWKFKRVISKSQYLLTAMQMETFLTNVRNTSLVIKMSWQKHMTPAALMVPKHDFTCQISIR